MSFTVEQWRQLALKLLLALGVFFVCRALFWVFNASFFPDAGPEVFWYGLRFDLSAAGWLFLPFVVLSSLPLPFHFRNFYQNVLRFFFLLPVTVTMLLNAIDFAYFPFTRKRSGVELLRWLGGEEDFSSLLPAVFIDFWYVSLTVILILVGVFFIHERIVKQRSKFTDLKLSKKGYIFGALFFVGAVLLTGTAARGGFQLAPLSPVDAGKYTSAQNTPLVLNTPFVLLRSFNREAMEAFDFMPQDEAEKLVSRKRFYGSDQKPKKNVVILILEGFSAEHVGYLNGNEGYTPNLDRILKRSLVFKNAFANGQKSIEALPAVLAGIPGLTNTPYIQSSYSTNNLFSLAHALRPHGYHTSFFHGGKKGTMGFDSFTQIAGFEHYYGKSDHPEAGEHFDGTWGIYDEPFFGFYAEKLNEFPQPFLSAFFSLSSHHPYTLPAKYDSVYEHIESPFLRSLAYADYALGTFFDKVKNAPWYNNTAFVITADHTAGLIDWKYRNALGLFRVPLAYYVPGDSLFETGTSARITQHIDILPSVLDLVGYPEPFPAWGLSVFRSQPAAPFAVTLYNNGYQWIEKDYMLRNDFSSDPQLYRFTDDVYLKYNRFDDEPRNSERMNRRLKAFLQLYAKTLNENTFNEY